MIMVCRELESVTGSFRYLCDEVELLNGSLVAVDAIVHVDGGCITSVESMYVTDAWDTYVMEPGSEITEAVNVATEAWLDRQWERQLDGVVCQNKNRMREAE